MDSHARNRRPITLLLAVGASIAAAVVLIRLSHSSEAPKEDSAPHASAENAAAQQTEQPARDSSQKHTNRLIRETSPYLLQHAHNPVNWYAWGDEAFAQAKKEGKPIFLSVGYSTCYWCHVMERESFEDEEVAEILNEHYIAIKVDREERPEIDEQYMLATQLLTARGGWPNSVWLTPDGRPWMAGTYYPRDTFKKVLLGLVEVWRTQRDLVDAQAKQMAAAIEAYSSPAAASTQRPVTPQLVSTAIAELQTAFDEQQGGFGDAPKFPPHGDLRLLIQQCRKTPNESVRTMITRTLDAMARGGVRDHVGGGFHRYAIDSRWLVPHFEKMLYDNAQLLENYAVAYGLNGDKRYRDVVQDIVAWLEREMISPDGAFYSALDSESEAEEGKFYVWTYEELLRVLGEEDGRLLAEVYGATRVGNFHDEATGKPTGANILYLPQSIEQVAAQKGPDAEDLRAQLEALRAKLLAARHQRARPHLDDKVLASWNGLMIGALAQAGRHLDEPRYTEIATKAAEFLIDHMLDQGHLLRSWRAGVAKQPAYLEDYALVARGLLELYETTGQPRWLDQSRRLVDVMVDEFEDESNGAFYFTTADHETRLVRSKNLLGGGNLPSANGAAAELLLRLGKIANEPRYTESGRRTIESLSWLMWQSPRGADSLVYALAIGLENGSISPTPDRDSAVAQLEPAPPKTASAEQTEKTKADASLEQRPVLIEAYASRVKLSPAQQFHVAVSLTIDPHWHLYGPNPDVDYLIPSTVSLAENAAVKAQDVIVPNGKTINDPVLNERVQVYEGRVWFLLPLQVASDAALGRLNLEIRVRTQACDKDRCLPPRTSKLNLPIEIGKAAADEPLRHRKIFSSLNVD